MKIITTILFTLPILAFANPDAKPEKPFSIFDKQSCASTAKTEQAKKNCLAAEKHQEASKNFRNFQDNNHMEVEF